MGRLGLPSEDGRGADDHRPRRCERCGRRARGVKPRALQPLLHTEPLWDLPYIHRICTERHFHGKRLSDGSSPGDALLVATLTQIEQLPWAAGKPYIWAAVNPKNWPCHKMFKRHGFSELSAEGTGDAIRIKTVI